LKLVGVITLQGDRQPGLPAIPNSSKARYRKKKKKKKTSFLRRKIAPCHSQIAVT